MPVKEMSSYDAVLKDAKGNCVKAAVSTVNITAAIARKNGRENIDKQFTTRNNFTVNSVLYTQCPKSVKKLGEIKSVAGITERAEYMERQEKGGTKKSPNDSNLIIPNTRARGGSNANKVRRKYNYNSIIQNKVNWSSRYEDKKQRFVATAFVAAKERKFMRMNDTFFLVTNFRKTKSGVKFKMKAMLNLKHKTTETGKNEWFEPASQTAAKEMQGIFNSQMDKL